MPRGNASTISRTRGLIKKNGIGGPGNPFEPKPRNGLPVCPKWLSDEAKRVWRRIAPDMAKCGLLTMVDAEAMTAYCQTWARWQGLAEYVSKNGETYVVRDAEGQIIDVRVLPQVAQMENALRMVLALQRELGLTPLSRRDMVVQQDNSTPINIVVQSMTPEQVANMRRISASPVIDIDTRSTPKANTNGTARSADGLSS